MAGTTIAAVTRALNRRWGECCGLADVQDALSRSLISLGGTPATLGTVTDSDLGAVTAGQYPQLLDVAEERGLATIVASLDLVDLTAFGITTDPDKLLTRYMRLLAMKRDYIKQTYGVGLTTLSVGVVDFNFQEQFDPTSGQLEF